MLNQVSVNRGLSWRPAPLSIQKTPFKAIRPLGQTPAAQGSVVFLDDPLLAATLDVMATGTSAYLAYGLAKAHNPWAPLWLVLATAMGVKALHDFSRIKS